MIPGLEEDGNQHTSATAIQGKEDAYFMDLWSSLWRRRRCICKMACTLAEKVLVFLLTA